MRATRGVTNFDNPIPWADPLVVGGPHEYPDLVSLSILVVQVDGDGNVTGAAYGGATLDVTHTTENRWSVTLEEQPPQLPRNSGDDPIVYTGALEKGKTAIGLAVGRREGGNLVGWVQSALQLASAAD
jgi:hypothetical protein